MKKEHQRQNILISAGLIITQTALLAAASHIDGPARWVAVVTFAFLFLTNYAMMHEAMHMNLHADRRTNQWCGRVLSWFFPVSFHFMQLAHDVHHHYNRTDHEMFDYYYEHDNRLVKFAQWYSILTGIYPPIIPVGSVLFAALPGLFRTRPWQRARSSNIIFNDHLFRPHNLRSIRIDVISGLLFWLLLFGLLKLDPLMVAVAYLPAWFNWSTRQYVTHAFSVRDIVNGAHNLTVSRPMSWVLLNGQWDLVHHQHPSLPWQSLPEKRDSTRTPIDYWKQYFRLWLGPRPNTEPAPVTPNHSSLRTAVSAR